MAHNMKLRKSAVKLGIRQTAWENAKGSGVSPKERDIKFDNKDLRYRKPGSNKK